MLHPDDLVGVDRARYVLFPIRHHEVIWDAYKKAYQSIWGPDDIDLAADRQHWAHELSVEERALMSMVLAFFAAADGLVVDNLAQRFCAEVQLPEARCFYGVQIMMENVHAEVYSRLIQELIPCIEEQTRLFSAVSTNPLVAAKGLWCLKWIEAVDKDFPTRLVAFAIVEGVFFASSFAAVFWLRQRGLMPGLVHANVMISRDEGLHMSFACLLYRSMGRPLSEDSIHTMIDEAVTLERAFFAACLPQPLVGMNSTLMKSYVEHVADVLLCELGHSPKYRTANPVSDELQTWKAGSRL
ncbi:putative ribonucleoside-diphosphate reductase small chain B [Earliella scabrosa]|nr:putative ribonucleoside-diphosphate reductase small chain B [Earliella scabrosa]